MIDPLGRMTQYDYDDANRVIAVHEPSQTTLGAADATATHYAYDTLGNLRLVTDPLTNTTQYQYDGQQRVKSEIDGNLHATTYVYGVADELKSLTDADGNKTTWEYDPAGQVTTETNQLTKAHHYLYDNFGRVSQMTDPDGRVSLYSYNDLNELTREEWFADQTTLDHFRENYPNVNALETLYYTYDQAGDLMSATDKLGSPKYPGPTVSSETFSYDALGNRTQTIDDFTGNGLMASAGESAGVTLRDQYSMNLLKQSSAAIGTSIYDSPPGNYGQNTANTKADFLNTYAYDALNRLKTLEQATQADAPANQRNSVSNKRVDLTYYADSQLETINRSANGSAVADSAHHYDTRGRLDGIAQTSHYPPYGNSPFTGYTYDAADQLKTVSGSDSASYQYNAAGQLTTSDISTTIGYDPNGNRNTGGFQVSSVGGTGNNQIAGDATYTYQYDAEGNIILRTKRDNSGYTTYQWDHRNRLTKVTDYSFITGAFRETQRVEYTYDALDQLIGRKVYLYGANGPSTSEHFIYDNGQIVLRLADDGTIQDRYLWGLAVDELLRRKQAPARPPTLRTIRPGPSPTTWGRPGIGSTPRRSARSRDGRRLRPELAFKHEL